MAAPKGNTFWQARSSHGRKPKFKSPGKLWAACCEYFEWVEDNPLFEAKAFSYQGKVTVAELPKMRAMTLDGLCTFLDIGTSTWDDYRGKEDFSEVITRVEAIIRTQKFVGAAADLLNPNIIARDLGLRDKQAHEHTGKDGGPIEQKVKYTDFPPEPKTIAEWEQQVEEARAARERRGNEGGDKDGYKDQEQGRASTQVRDGRGTAEGNRHLLQEV